VRARDHAPILGQWAATVQVDDAITFFNIV
jgi:hypothetical protein